MKYKEYNTVCVVNSQDHRRSATVIRTPEKTGDARVA